MQQIDDEHLIQLIISKDEAALSELYDRFHRLVFTVAVNIVGRREEAEEITLDIFTRVWEKADTYRSDRGKVQTWLTRMARNRSIDVLRRQEVRPLKHSIQWAEVSPEPSTNQHNPESSAHLSLEVQRIRQAMASLPENQQEVLALAYFKGYTHSEMARILDLPLGTVKGRIRAGMQKLREQLKES